MFEKFLQSISQSITTRNESISAHYGEDDNYFRQRIRDIQCDLLRATTYSEVVDDRFPKMNSDSRLRVLAFAIAFHNQKIYEKMLRENQ